MVANVVGSEPPVILKTLFSPGFMEDGSISSVILKTRRFSVNAGASVAIAMSKHRDDSSSSDFPSRLSTIFRAVGDALLGDASSSDFPSRLSTIFRTVGDVGDTGLIGTVSTVVFGEQSGGMAVTNC